jgi:uncharacterized protein YyaL (SSP411 family)
VVWYSRIYEAIEKVREDKPLLVSIGYSMCYWCDIMKKESFENQTAAVL